MCDTSLTAADGRHDAVMAPLHSHGVDISVVIPSYNRAHDVGELLACLARQQLRSETAWEVIVVDNGSTDSTQSVLDEWRPRLPLRAELERQRGSSAARNRGIRVAMGKLIAFADSDVLVGPRWVQTFLDSAIAHPDIAYFGGLIIPRYQHPPPAWYAGVGQGSHGASQLGLPARPAVHVSGGSWACRADALASVGLFDTRIGPGDLPTSDRRIVGNEAELMDRLARNGFAGMLLPSPDVAAEHKVTVQETRLNYVLRWYFGLGRGEALRATVPCTRVLGFPRWRIRRGLTDSLSFVWHLLRLERSKAVKLLTQVSVSAGYVYESWRRR